MHSEIILGDHCEDWGRGAMEAVLALLDEEARP